ncbi:hypothetical protein CIK05_01725 [Bdellovibrio sp. qaytius]|nr:hypothetical protein CIK05_01725 [Bdellovibrio sp. qaytius]
MPKLTQFIALLVVFMLKPVLASANSQQAIEAVDPEKYRWLYELIIPEQDRTVQADKAFKSFNVHLKDTYENYPTPISLSRNNFNLKNSIQGKITYVEFFPKKYNYDVIYSTDSSKVTIRVKVNFINPTGQDLENFKKKFAEAEEIWNSHQIPLDFKYHFQFQVVNSVKEAHFSVLVLEDTRGPYDTSWNRNWKSTSIAHELGHMMGLGDEYETISSESYCLPQSLMCESNSASPMYHHYYFILRRLMK